MTTENAPGLEPEEHGDLNRPNLSYPGGEEARNARIDELKQKYADDPFALRQIEAYTRGSEYHEIHDRYRLALRDGDEETAAELSKWFDQNPVDTD